MTESAFLKILQSLHASLGASLLERPVAETGLDSFDLLELRSTLEANLGRPIDDETWLAARTLRALLEALP